MASQIDIVTKGSTDRSVTLRIIDSTDGTPETGVVFNSAGIDLWFRREGALVSSVTEVTLAALTTAHADGGFLHVSDGEYRFDLPDAAFASGVNYVDVGGTVTGMVVIGGRVRLTDFDIETATQPANVTQLGGVVQSLTDLKDFADAGYDPATNKVQGVVLVDTTTANTDMLTDTAVWASATRTLTSFGFTPASNITQVLGTALTETVSGDLSKSISFFFDVNPTTTTTVDNVRNTTATAATAAFVQDMFTVDSGEVSGSEVTGSLTLEIAKIVWDRVLTGATHNISTSAGRRIRGIQDFQGYEGGLIYINTTGGGTPGTTDFENGTVENPVDSLADALTLNTSLGLNGFSVSNGSTVAFVEDHVGEDWTGNNWTLTAAISRSISSAVIEGANVTGIFTGAVAPRFEKCTFGTATTVPPCRINGNSVFTGTLTFGSAGDYVFIDCSSGIAGSSTPVIDTGAGIANVNLSMPDYHNGVEIRNLNQLGTDLFSISGTGQIIYAASSSGAVNQRGDWKVTNTGGVTITADDNTTGISDILVDTADMQPKLGTPAADVSADIAALQADLDTLTDGLILQTTTIATLASQTSFTLTAGSADDVAYEGATIVIQDASTAVQKAFGSLSAYTGVSKTVTLAQDPGVYTMAVGDKIYILASDVFANMDRVLTGAKHNVANSLARRIRQLSETIVIFSGTAQAGSTTNTIILDTGASSTDGAYDPAMVSIVSGTGAGQTRLILEYAGSTRIAVVDRNWKTTPDATSEFIISADAGREHVNEGLLQAATATTATLNALASSSDNVYNGQQLFLRAGTGDDQVGSVIDYNGTTKVATIFPAWSITPDATTSYVMLPIFRPEVTLRKSLAQAGTSTTITLDAGASALNDFYKEARVTLTAGTGGGQDRQISGYVGATKVATVMPAWVTNPDSTSQFVVMPASVAASLAELNDLSAAQVNAEVADVIRTDVTGEPAQDAPPASASLSEKIDWIYKTFRNKKTQTATTWSLFNDAGTVVDSKATVSDDGTTATKTEIISGP